MSGRHVLLTGAAGGLGTTIATALSSRGAVLMLVDVNAAALLSLRDRLSCHALVADVADADDRARIISHCERAEHVPDVLINNAGIEKASEFDRLEPEEVRHALDVNLVGAMLLTHAALGGLRTRGRGHVISIASMAGIKPVPFNAVYNTAKAGLVGFSLSLSKELAGSGVDATVICPSAVTGVGMWARVSDQLTPNRLVESSAVTPDAVAAAVVRALEQRPRRILVGSPLVRAGALLSALSPRLDALTDRLSRIDSVYRERIRTDRDNRL
ncbi:MAG: SDR family NAD(P)-dependent oxidoreductase [Candidatus Dormibacteraeota bacterium]|uniref:SDR family NAD(P)-dependent oxidoreductase n=1 Tax=Candidatus Aeolococcus gillhamiae TaxID=3127015 RepID=A0A934N0G0_9BACT|nr:SDR family NAD(P)-dependent oxidoreductase [Candidatus Dormibacteraeota bacterium]